MLLGSCVEVANVQRFLKYPWLPGFSRQSYSLKEEVHEGEKNSAEDFLKINNKNNNLTRSELQQFTYITGMQVVKNK